MDAIIIEDSELKNNRLTCRLKAPRRIKKYIKDDILFAEYDVEINAHQSILNILLTATVLPLAWLTGVDVKLSVLDHSFKESMDQLKQVFKPIHPRIPFTSRILVENLIENSINPSNPEKATALLFSGGVDSTYSLISNIDKKPRLLMFWGVDNFSYPENRRQWEHIYSTYQNQAERLGLEINLVKTNISQILDTGRIDHDFHWMLYNGSFRGIIQHSLILLPLAAPISTGRFNKLLIASSGSQPDDYESPWGSTSAIDEKIIWADLNVRHDGNIPRSQKITGDVKDYLLMNKMLLRVCLRKLDEALLNDSICEKCLRTIASLILNGIDPNQCGFEVNSLTFQSMRRFLEGERVDNDLVTNWGNIQELIPEEIVFDYYGSREFFEWFKSYDFTLDEGNIDLLRSIYNKLPYMIAKSLDKVYRRLGYNIHEGSPIRKNVSKDTADTPLYVKL